MRSVAAAVGTGTGRDSGDPREAPTRDMAATRPGYSDPARYRRPTAELTRCPGTSSIFSSSIVQRSN